MVKFFEVFESKFALSFNIEELEGILNNSESLFRHFSLGMVKICGKSNTLIIWMNSL